MSNNIDVFLDDTDFNDKSEETKLQIASEIDLINDFMNNDRPKFNLKSEPKKSEQKEKPKFIKQKVESKPKPKQVKQYEYDEYDYDDQYDKYYK